MIIKKKKGFIFNLYGKSIQSCETLKKKIKFSIINSFRFFEQLNTIVKKKKDEISFI
jgi:hypothetical protein